MSVPTILAARASGFGYQSESVLKDDSRPHMEGYGGVGVGVGEGGVGGGQKA